MIGLDNKYSNTASMLPDDPIWDSYTEQLKPKTMRDALHWSIYLRHTFGDVTSSLQRGVSYFVGGIDLVAANENDIDAVDRYEKELLDKHGLLPLLTEIGMDLEFNGNVFLSVLKPIKRSLSCPKCKAIRFLGRMERDEDYKFNDGVFTSECTCGYKGEFEVLDFPDERAERPLNVINWNPLNINIDYCSLTNSERISYTPEAKDMEFLNDSGQSAALETLPLTLLQAMCTKSSIVFDPDQILHLKHSSDAIDRAYTLGWGLPRWLASFKYIVMLLLLERQMEYCVKDVMLPIRFLFPDASQKGSDPSVGSQHNIHLQHFKQNVENALKSHSYKKSSWHMLPQAVASMQLGGEGKSLIPIEIFEYMKGGLLDSLCIPDEFRKSTLFSGANAQPISLRMFEKTWANDALQLDIALRWYLDKCKSLLGWPDMEGVLIRPSILNDPARMQIMAQEVEAGRLSRSTLLRALCIDARADERLRMQEIIAEQKFQQELNARLETMGVTSDLLYNANRAILQAGADSVNGEAQGGVPAAQGGAPMPPQDQTGGALPGAVQQPPQTGDPMMDIQNMASMRPGASVSVDQLNADAQYAAQIIASTPVGAARNQIYSMIKSANPDLHAIVMSIVDQLEQQARRQGLEAARQGQM
jgi:hypothetical protein